MTEQAPDRLWSGIDIPKTIAAALAAVCAAVIGSFLGVAGTLIGAAVASVIGSVGTEVYQRSIKKGTEKLQIIAPTFIKVPAAVGTPEVAAATEDESPSHTVAPESGRTIRWGRVAAIAGALFVLAIGSLTVAELMTGRPVASTVGNTSSTGTTVGSVFRSGNSSTPTPAPSVSPSDQQTTPADEEPATPAETPEATVPTTGPAAEPTTEAPATPAPQQTTPPADTQQRDQNQGGTGTE
jgi:hypothetical protein